MPGDDMERNLEGETHVSSVSLPPFWPTKPELWFSMVEAKFNLSRITNETTRFFHVLTVLSPETANEVSDIITEPDQNIPYTKLKQAVIARTSLSETQKLQQLLSGEQLGSHKPTQLLRSMKSLVKDTDSVKECVLRELFLKQMPSAIQQGGVV